jgi:hypothetical protein
MAVGDSAPRSRSRDTSGFESHRRGRIFFRGRNLRRAMDVYVCLSGADGRVVEGRATLFRHHREVSRARIPGRMRPPMDVVLYSCCVVQKGERRREGGRGWPGTVPRSPAAHKEKKERKKQARYLIDQYGERGKATTKKKELIVLVEI